MSLELSDNQVRLMLALRRAGKPVTTRQLGSVRDAHRNLIAADPARKILGRLEKRGLVAGEGKGVARGWTLTSEGDELLEQLRPSTGDEDGSPVRTYYVFEEVTLEQLLDEISDGDWGIAGDVDPTSVVLYRRKVDVEARNTTHAYRVAGAKAYPGQDVDPRLVAVADRMFQPKKCRVRNNTSVAVG